MDRMREVGSKIDALEQSELMQKMTIVMMMQYIMIKASIM